MTNEQEHLLELIVGNAAQNCASDIRRAGVNVDDAIEPIVWHAESAIRDELPELFERFRKFDPELMKVVKRVIKKMR